MTTEQTGKTSLEITLETSDNVAKITLAGDLDASTATGFKDKVEEAAKLNPQRLVLMMEGLE